MRYRIQAQSIWEYGQRRDAEGNPHQEDSLFPAQGQASVDDHIFILCDGMGGHDAGEVASATVCEAMGRSLLQACPTQDCPLDDGRVHQAVADAFDALNARALSLGGDRDSPKRMGTTMALLVLHSQGATVAHMGDSRVYHIRPGKRCGSARVLWHTEDHSLVNDLVRLGEITPEEARTHPRRNVVTRAMQPFVERRQKADIHHIDDIQEDDFFYLCSDGMLENMDDSQLCFFFSAAVPVGQRREMLRQATRENSDNHSAWLVEVVAVEPKRPRRHRWRWLGC